MAYANPFEEFDKRLNNIERLLLDIKHGKSILSDFPVSGATLPRYMTREEAAKFLGVSLHTLNKWTKEGKVKGYRIASRVRYEASEIENSLIKIAV